MRRIQKVCCSACRCSRSVVATSASSPTSKAPGAVSFSPRAYEKKSIIVSTSSVHSAMHAAPSAIREQHLSAKDGYTPSTEGPPPTTVTSGTSEARIGNSTTTLLCGVVSNVRHGSIANGTIPATMFTVRSLGYRHRRAGQLKLHANEVTVRVSGDAANFTILDGSKVTVKGAVSLHVTYDLVSKSNFENIIVDVHCERGGFVGLISPPSSGPVNAR